MVTIDQDTRKFREQTDTRANIVIPPPIPNNPENDFFKFRIDFSDEIDETIHRLMGEIPKIEGNEITWIVKYAPMVNDDFLNSFIYILASCGLSKGIVLGNLSDEQINRRMQSLWIKLAKLIHSRYWQYGIKKEMRSVVIATIINPIHSALSRSEGGLEARQLSTAAQMIIHRHEADAIKGNSSSFNPLNFFKK